MKVCVVLLLVVAAAAFSSAEDDGQYHPERYGDDGRYRPTDEGRYYARYQQLYQPVYRPAYQQVYTYNPYYTVPQYRTVITPVVSYGDSVDAAVPLATSVSTVSVRPPLPKLLPPVTARAPLAAVLPAVAVTTARPVLATASANAAVLPLYGRAYQYYRDTDKNANILRQHTELNGNTYNYDYQTQNGIAVAESGNVAPAVNGGGTRATGFYEYIGDDGLKYRVDYTADENGFRPVGTHLPSN